MRTKEFVSLRVMTGRDINKHILVRLHDMKPVELKEL
jgi:hypothetical protein